MAYVSQLADFSPDLLDLMKAWDPSAKQDELVRFYRAREDAILVVPSQGVASEAMPPDDPTLKALQARGLIPVVFTAGDQRYAFGVKNHVFDAPPMVEAFQRSLDRVQAFQGAEMNDFDSWLLRVLPIVQNKRTLARKTKSDSTAVLRVFSQFDARP